MRREGEKEPSPARAPCRLLPASKRGTKFAAWMGDVPGRVASRQAWGRASKDTEGETKDGERKTEGSVHFEEGNGGRGADRSTSPRTCGESYDGEEASAVCPESLSQSTTRTHLEARKGEGSKGSVVGVTPSTPFSIFSPPVSSSRLP